MCTGIRLKATNGATIYARTLEFGKDIESKIIIIPKNYAFKGTTPSDTAQGLQWHSTYAVVGANACNIVGVIDGINEAGLAGGLFYFSDYAEYQTVSPDQLKNSLAPWELMSWILTTCATIAQVQETLPTIRIGNAVFGPWGITPPVHAIVHDADGNSLVIEYVKGQLHMYANPLGVFTNAPTFDWHLINIKNYINLAAANIPSRTLKGVLFNPLGQGSGMLGLPGDFTSPSRFIRAVAFSQAVVNPKTEQDALQSAFHILNLFDIPKGVVREHENNHVAYDHTQWASACDLKNKRYYFHTYDNRIIRMVDLEKIKNTAQQSITFSMHSEESIVDITLK